VRIMLAPEVAQHFQQSAAVVAYNQRLVTTASLL
jgi:hypothetical protein